MSFAVVLWQELSKSEKGQAYKKSIFLWLKIFFGANFVLGFLSILFLFNYLPEVTFTGGLFSALACIVMTSIITFLTKFLVSLLVTISTHKERQKTEYVQQHSRMPSTIMFLLTSLSLYAVSKIFPHTLNFSGLAGVFSASFLLLMARILSASISQGAAKIDEVDVNELLEDAASNPEFRKKAGKIFKTGK